MRISRSTEMGIADSGSLFSRVRWTILIVIRLFREVIFPFSTSFCYIRENFLWHQLSVLKFYFLALVYRPTMGPILVLLSYCALLSGAEPQPCFRPGFFSGRETVMFNYLLHMYWMKLTTYSFEMKGYR